MASGGFRNCIQGIVALLVLAILASSPAQSVVNTDHASQLVESTIIRIDWLINADIPREELFSELELVFRNRAATSIICRSALGRIWSTATVSKKNEFLDVFIRYMSEKYSRYFNRFIGSEFKVAYSRTTRNARYFEVKTIFDKKGQQPYPVYWYLTVVNSEPRIYNIIVDDLNLLALEKSVMRNLLQQNGNDIDNLIRLLPTRYYE